MSALALAEQLTLLAGDFELITGPVWQVESSRLLFNDVLADTAYAWSEDGGLSTVRQPTRSASGQVIDLLGRLIVCEHLTHSLVMVSPTGEQEVLASHYQGRSLNGPSDVVTAPDGSLLFTDPPFGGRDGALGARRPMELGFCGVYRWAGSDGVHLLSTRLAEPNSLCLSLDQARLYVCDASSGEIIEFKTSWGSGGLLLDEGHVFARLPDAEADGSGGMKIDARGSVWCAGAGGVHVFRPSGERIGVVEIPEPVRGLEWGGLDGRDLYLTAAASLYCTRTAVAGADWV